MLARARIPNLLTGARLCAVPLCLAIILLHPPFGSLILFVLFVVASLTDFLDGYLARKWNVVSPLGAMLDPIADKLLVALMLLYLMAKGAAPFLPVSIILLRELYISGLREYLASKQIALPVSRGGKWKTALQMVAIALLLALPMIQGAIVLRLLQLSTVLLYVAAALAVASAFTYSRASWKHVR